MEEYIINEIKSRDKHGIDIESMFNIATARGKRIPLIRFDIERAAGENVFKSVVSSLKNAKRKGIIEMYVPAEEMSSGGTAASYLANKHPVVSELSTPESCYSIYIKI